MDGHWITAIIINPPNTHLTGELNPSKYANKNFFTRNSVNMTIIHTHYGTQSHCVCIYHRYTEMTYSG